MKNRAVLSPLLFLAAATAAQPVPILGFSVDASGRAQISVASTEDSYFVLLARQGATERATSISIGKNGSATLSEPLAALPESSYSVLEFSKNTPADTDGDGLDDLAELADLGRKSPLNAAPAIDPDDGATAIPDRFFFKKLAFEQPDAGEPALDGVEEVKFFIKNRDDDQPLLYFINSKKWAWHTDFAHHIGYSNDGTLMTGSVLFHPNVVAANGSLGAYRFTFEPNNSFPFPLVRKAMELLAANLPFLKNNLCYYPLEPGGLPVYQKEKAAFDTSRVCVMLESDLFAGIDYVALHPAEGFGTLRPMQPGETPGPRDVVVYESLPNQLPRVGGIVTTVMQTPLSHVNLRAIQDNVPNAFVRDALGRADFDSLIGRYVFFKAEKSGFTLRLATKAEVDKHYQSIRPARWQRPVRDLSQKEIRPLDSIFFQNSTAFGVKCANVATMRRFGFPDGTIPDGFGVPFFFYDEFMKSGGLYDEARAMMGDPVFQTDAAAREQMLSLFRKKIKAAPLPAWMENELAAMQSSFPPGVSIRCRSSTNNEDLPGFSGAGLYDSFTQHPDEGTISKSIKQVFASMWNFRAYEERDFYRIDHFAAAMGVLVIPAYQHELANGVGVTIDPAYQTDNTFYLNTQVGEDLVTNPAALSTPEEILLDEKGGGFAVVNRSNQLPPDSLILTVNYLEQMRGFLTVIRDSFRLLYKAEDAPGFAMEIEFKIDSAGQLAIKQARPWAGFRANQDGSGGGPTGFSGLKIWPNPVRGVAEISCSCQSPLVVGVFDALGRMVEEVEIDFRKSKRQVDFSRLASGAYFLHGVDEAGGVFLSGKVLRL